ncbi:MAG: alpha/beta hydrolase [Clostridia bacterium]|nr:alpha/beta hydrolase [Clostridia bacterium]
MNDMILLKDIAYGTHERQTVDIFLPEIPCSDSGIIFYVHGGGWTMGDKTVHHPDAEHFCNLGYICASMNYRYIDKETNIFDELDDITSALKTVKITLAEHGFNVEKMIISGGSAGGHLSLMYAYTRMNEAPIKPVASCVYCPAVDCSKTDFLMGISGEFEDWKNGILSFAAGVNINKENFSDETRQTALKKISPVTYVSENCVPTAVFQGKLDDLVPNEHIKNFIDILDEYGIKNDLLIYENSGHALDKNPEKVLQAKEIIRKYSEMYFK